MLCLNDKDDENCKLEELDRLYCLDCTVDWLYWKNFNLRLQKKNEKSIKLALIYDHTSYYLLLFSQQSDSWVGPKSEEFNEIHIINNIDS